MTEEGFAEGLSQYRAKDGSVHYLEYRTKLITGDQKSDHIVGVARDVTHRVLTEKALKESEKKYEILVESAHEGICHVDLDGVIRYANTRMKEILKETHPEGKNILDFFDEENAKIAGQNLSFRKEGKSSTYYVTLTDLEGADRALVVSGTPYSDDRGNVKGSIAILTDISELRKLEAQLQQSQKMEAIGTLAGGIAHDFNNILSGVLGYASLITKQVPAASQLGRYANMIEKSAQRGAALADHLLAFSRKGKHIVKDVDVHPAHR